MEDVRMYLQMRISDLAWCTAEMAWRLEHG